ASGAGHRTAHRGVHPRRRPPRRRRRGGRTGPPHRGRMAHTDTAAHRGHRRARPHHRPPHDHDRPGRPRTAPARPPDRRRPPRGPLVGRRWRSAHSALILPPTSHPAPGAFMSAAVHAQSGADHTDLPYVLRAAVKLGVLEAVAVLVIGLASRSLEGVAETALLGVLVTATSVAGTVPPGRWTRRAPSRGVAGAG